MQFLRICATVMSAFCLGLLLTAGATQAGVETPTNNKVEFHITDSAAYTYHTTDQTEYETATVYFKVKFDSARSGYMQGASIKFTYDPARVTLIEARPAEGWGAGVSPLLVIGNGPLDTVYYDIDPAPGTSTIPNAASETIIAEFDFRVDCQTSPAACPLTILYGGGGTWVDDGVDMQYVNTSSRTYNGSMAVWQPYWAAWLADTFGHLEAIGALGKVIEVPITVGGAFKLASADMKFSYDVARLEYKGLTGLDASITDTASTYPTSGQLRVQFGTNEAIVPRHQFESEVIGKLKFLVLGNWQGSSTTVSWVVNPSFTVAQDAGTCAVPFSNGATAGCTITIPAYMAGYETEFTDGGTMSLTDGQATMKINLVNNFPAGGGNNKIIANLKLDTSLQVDLVDPGVDFGMHVYPSSTGQEVSLRLETGKYFDTSTSGQEMVSITILKKTNFRIPTTFENRFYPVHYMNTYDADPTVNARVTDTTGRVSTNNVAGNLYYDTPRIEYLMGEYYCPSVSTGSGLIAQDYYMRSSFALHDFRVKITVSGSHNIYTYALEPGVVVDTLDLTSYKWIILKAGPGWTNQAAGDTRIKFATITYSYSGAHADLPLALSQPGTGPRGHWETRTSTVSFVYDAASGYYMKAPDEYDQHEVAIGGTLTNRWWVDDNIPQPDLPNDMFALLAGSDGLPREYSLMQNYPNPFNPTTEFWYALPEGAYVEIAVYNITGQKVTTLVEGWREAGFHNESWDASDMASGVYFYRLQTDKFSESKKMILLK
jgi:hypothetical protein